MQFRKDELEKAKHIVSDQLKSFSKIHQARKVERALSEIPLQVKSLRQHALKNVFSKEVDQMDDSSKETLNKVLDYLEKKYISLPIKSAKEALVEKD